MELYKILLFLWLISIPILLKSEPTIPVLLKSEPIISIEYPIHSDSFKSGIVSFYGFSTFSKNLNVFVDSEFMFNIPVGFPRNDVANFYSLPLDERYGWNFIINMDLFTEVGQFQNGIVHVIEVYGEFGEVDRVVLNSVNSDNSASADTNFCETSD